MQLFKVLKIIQLAPRLGYPIRVYGCLHYAAVGPSFHNCAPVRACHKALAAESANIVIPGIVAVGDEYSVLIGACRDDGLGYHPPLGGKRSRDDQQLGSVQAGPPDKFRKLNVQTD